MTELASPEQDARPRLTEQEAQHLVLQTVARHADALLRTARRNSLCFDDAQDAYQRGLEIFMRRAATLDPATAERWLHVVIRHEAIDVRRARSQAVPPIDIDYELHEARHVASPEERVLTSDRATRAAEALRRLKPQELRAMWLKAMGNSYADAADNTVSLRRPRPLLVDTRAPAAPVGLRSPVAAATAPSFSADWSLPADTGTPITAARYQVCQGGSCGPVATAPGLTHLDAPVPSGSGPATLRVWLADGLGHEAPGAAATVALTRASAETPAPPAPAPGTDPSTLTLPIDCCATPILPVTPSATARVPAGLRLATLRRVGRRVAVAGTLTRLASGRVTIRYRVRRAGRTTTLTTRAAIHRGAWHTTLTLPSRVAPARRATVTVTYAGDADTRPGTRSATLRLAR
ncbi:sigma-70 family RNA polymerase sigma factor [Baekduia soli]|uniref:Sigma-70 family RNA polymerase sigma factor n=1 Tax=Baekduia soli TaxID=496014 RepID=A0A5B8UAC9_9ACTN|nr:sigma-70 family RNA polymerase sigma factor [Baekduia soli]QEC49987.1 sigma-70 family RNA polymerase sigma factor [Baekduia soli]